MTAILQRYEQNATFSARELQGIHGHNAATSIALPISRWFHTRSKNGANSTKSLWKCIGVRITPYKHAWVLQNACKVTVRFVTYTGRFTTIIYKYQRKLHEKVLSIRRNPQNASKFVYIYTNWCKLQNDFDGFLRYFDASLGYRLWITLSKPAFVKWNHFYIAFLKSVKN